MPQTRISESSHQLLKSIAAGAGKTFEEVIDDALSAYQRDRLLDEINAGYAALRANAAAWAAEQLERKLWDATLGDGVADEARQ